MKRIENRTFLFLVLFFSSVMFCMAQNIGKMAILSFNGGSQDEKDGIAELFSFTPQIMRNFTVIPRTTITRAIAREQSFQISSGMTDADTMVRLGNQFGADYVMAGSITSLGSSRLLIVSIVAIREIQQVAGAFLHYNSLDDFNKDGTIIEKMAAELVSLMKKDTRKMDKLAVLPVQFSGGANERDGDALAQLLSIYLIRNGKYAVYPRTKTLEQVQSEYDTQMSGNTRDSEAVLLGRGINPTYVLSIVSRRIGTVNRFNASVIDLEGGHQVAVGTEPYATLSDGINAMDFLAKTLSGIQVSERERSRRDASIASTADAEEKARQKEEADREREEAAKKRQTATDNFLRKAGITFDGWIGFINYKWPDGRWHNKCSGGGEIGLRLSPYFDLLTGLTVFQDMEYPFSEPIITQTILQLPVLARVNLILGFIDVGFCISPYGGIGINLFSIHDTAAIQSFSQYGFIVGVNVSMFMSIIRLFAGYQYNRDFSDTVYTFRDGSFSYLGERSIWCLGIELCIPFK
jgi:hypothetical protein